MRGTDGKSGGGQACLRSLWPCGCICWQGTCGAKKVLTLMALEVPSEDRVWHRFLGGGPGRRWHIYRQRITWPTRKQRDGVGDQVNAFIAAVSGEAPAPGDLRMVHAAYLLKVPTSQQCLPGAQASGGIQQPDHSGGPARGIQDSVVSEDLDGD